MKELINLNLYLNHLRNAVALANPDGTLFFKNSVFDILFIRKITQGTPHNLFEIFGDDAAISETLKKVVDLRGSYILRDIPVFLSQGEERHMDIEAFPLIADGGDLLGMSLFFHDRAGTVRLEQHQKRVDRIQYLATIASGLAHEIKNPLSGIQGASQLLAESLGDNKELQEYAEIIRKEVIRVDRLLKDLLDFTKPRKLTKKMTNVNQILHDLVVLQKTIDPSQIKFYEVYDPSLPEIMADPQALSQLFLNLLKNARQAIKKEGQVIIRSGVVTDFGLKKGEKRRQLINVEIEDTGEGIDPAILSNIFVPFFTTKAKGTGLGLALSYQLVEEHEGDIQIKSEKGKGTSFSVYLPV